MVNINCKVPLVIYDLNHDSLQSEDPLNYSRCGSQCMTLPRERLKETGNHAMGTGAIAGACDGR